MFKATGFIPWLFYLLKGLYFRYFLNIGGCFAVKGNGEMKTKVALLSLGLVSMGFCIDEYQPIAPQTISVDLGYKSVFETGRYDNGGTRQDIHGSPVTNIIGVQVKYGIIDGLDAELAWAFRTDYDMDVHGSSMSGFIMPDLAVKYALAEYGVGVYLNVVFPFVTGDYDKALSRADFGFAPGIVYGKNFGKFQAVGQAEYLLNLENGDKVKQSDQLMVYLKPGYSITDELCGYLGLKYTMYGKEQISGYDVSRTGDYLFSILPGAKFTQNKMITYELNIPITLAGKNKFASWGVFATVYFTFGN